MDDRTKDILRRAGYGVGSEPAKSMWVRDVIEKACVEEGITVEFTTKPLPAPIVASIGRGVVLANPDIMTATLEKIQFLYPRATWGEKVVFIRDVVRHEAEHLRVANTLRKMGYTTDQLTLTEFVLASEMYLNYAVPPHEFEKGYLRDEVLTRAMTEQGGLWIYQEASRNPLYALAIALMLPKDEIIGTFRLEYPEMVDFLLDLKGIATRTTLIRDIPRSAEEIRTLVRW